MRTKPSASRASGGRSLFEIPPPPSGVDAWASAMGGAWLVMSGLTRRAPLRLPMLAIGGWLLGRGVSGLYERSTELPSPPRLVERLTEPADPLDEGLEESFPASDPLAVSPRRD